jgi:hypothetical protein
MTPSSEFDIANPLREYAKQIPFNVGEVVHPKHRIVWVRDDRIVLSCNAINTEHQFRVTLPRRAGQIELRSRTSRIIHTIHRRHWRPPKRIIVHLVIYIAIRESPFEQKIRIDLQSKLRTE